MPAADPSVVILGAGMSGLGAALSSGLPVYEAASEPGGVCHSYYLAEDGTRRDPRVDAISQCFRFEPAGGHWLFGVTPPALSRLTALCPLRRYARRSAVLLNGCLVAYPLQDNLRYLDAALREQVLAEIEASCPTEATDPSSFKDWLFATFGASLCELFFFPFNARYTAGLYDDIAPQDLYKSAIDRDRVRQGAAGPVTTAGYNNTFYYPEGGLDRLVRAIGAHCDVRTGHRVEAVDTNRREVIFGCGTSVRFERIVSTIPLDAMLRLCSIECDQRPDPATSVLVANIGATRGEQCPSSHWVYLPRSSAGIHRVGFYSNVDPSFLPARHRSGGQLVSLYAERSFAPGARPGAPELRSACRAIVDELKALGFIRDEIVVDSTFTDPAYTWCWRGSRWAREAVCRLAEQGVQQVGRFATWRFQGMVASFEQGFAAGEAFQRQINPNQVHAQS